MRLVCECIDIVPIIEVSNGLNLKRVSIKSSGKQDLTCKNLSLVALLGHCSAVFRIKPKRDATAIAKPLWMLSEILGLEAGYRRSNGNTARRLGI
jgi:hypothetical protein